MRDDRIVYNKDKKFDIQLKKSVVDERALGDLLLNGKIEMKAERWLWEKTGNICIEIERDGKPSGLMVTEADVWCHALVRDDVHLGYFMIPVDRLKYLCIKYGKRKENGGDGNRQTNMVIQIWDLFKE